MKQRIIPAAVLVLCALTALLASCGGSGSHRAADGRFALTVKWPEPGRLVPAASNSIKAVLSRGGTNLGERLLVRPAQSPWTTTVTYDDLAPGEVILTATAFPLADGSGVAQAVGSAPASIVGSRTAQVTVNMASTIDHLAITPSNPSVTIGASIQLNMTAFDAQNSVVLVVPANISWTSAAQDKATVDSTGKATGAAVGAAQVTVLESESRKSANTTVTVDSASGVNPLMFPRRVAIHPKGTFAYVTNNLGVLLNTPGNVAQFRVNVDGTLTPLNPPTVAAGGGMLDVRVDNSGRYLYATSGEDSAFGGSPGVYQYSINQVDGTLTPLNPPRLTTGGGASAILLNLDGVHAYVHDSDGHVRVAQIGPDGTLTYQGDALGTAAVFNNLAMDPLGRYLYSGGQGGIDQFRIETTGLLTSLSRGFFAPVSGIGVNPTGQYLYSAGFPPFNGTMAFQFAIQSNGKLTPLNPPSIAAGQATNDLAFNKSGTTLYVTDYTDDVGPGKVWQFRVMANGTLSPLSPSNVAAGVGPSTATVSPSGDFLYIANSAGGTISIFRINADGTLTIR